MNKPPDELDPYAQRVLEEIEIIYFNESPEDIYLRMKKEIRKRRYKEKKELKSLIEHYWESIH